MLRSKRKLRGKKAKERKKWQRPRRVAVRFDFLKKLNEPTPENIARKKRVRQHLGMLSKYWGFRKRLLIGVCGPLYRDRGYPRQFDQNRLIMARREAERRTYPVILKLQSYQLY